MTAFTHDALANDLAEHLAANRNRMIWTNLQLGPMHSPRPDVYVLERTYTKFTPTAYEAKVSRSDFLADVTTGKWQSYLEYAAAVVFAAPAGLITRDEVPPRAGLIIRHANTWRMAKRPTPAIIDNLPKDAWLKLLMDGVERTVDQRVQTARERAGTWYRTEAAVTERFGRDLAKRLASIYANEAEAERLEAFARSEVERTRDQLERDRERLRNCVRHELEPALRKLARAIGLTDLAEQETAISEIDLLQLANRARDWTAGSVPKHLVETARSRANAAINSLEFLQEQLRRLTDSLTVTPEPEEEATS